MIRDEIYLKVCHFRGGWRGERGEVLFNIHFEMPIESPIALYG